jgi:hypothetical protein
MTQGGDGVIQKMTDVKNSRFKCYGVQYILIKSIDGGMSDTGKGTQTGSGEPIGVSRNVGIYLLKVNSCTTLVYNYNLRFKVVGRVGF